jgi:hypothetical protein
MPIKADVEGDVQRTALNYCRRALRKPCTFRLHLADEQRRAAAHTGPLHGEWATARRGTSVAASKVREGSRNIRVDFTPALLMLMLIRLLMEIGRLVFVTTIIILFNRFII